MRKKTILNALKELKKHCETDSEIDALEVVSKLAKGLPEDVVEESQEIGEFVVPKEAMALNAFTLYSDGACRGNPGPGAWGSLGQDPLGNVVFEISGFDHCTTNNRMELEAAIKALETFIDHAEENSLSISSALFLYSDSKYVVDGLEKWVPGWKRRGWKKADNKAPENIALWQRLDELKARLPGLRMRWVKGHSGHPQNERCDQLANFALDDAGM